MKKMNQDEFVDWLETLPARSLARQRVVFLIICICVTFSALYSSGLEAAAIHFGVFLFAGWFAFYRE